MGNSDNQDQQQQQPQQVGQTPEASLDNARQFLRDEEVRQASPEKKTEFLKFKGFSESQIQTLLDEEKVKEKAVTAKDPAPEPEHQKQADRAKEEETLERKRSEEKHAPIVTYPEFLAKPARPPPLVTPTGFLNTLYTFAGLSTLAYGVAQYVVAPKVASLDDARIELHETALTGVSALVSKLESVVSEIPPSVSSPSPNKATTTPGHDRDNNNKDDDDATTASSCDDPTEVFHRDVGVQTVSLPPSPKLRPSSSYTDLFATAARQSTTTGSQQPPLSPAEHGSPAEGQAAHLAKLTRSLHAVRRGLVAESESYDHVNTTLNAFKTDLDQLTYPAAATMASGASYSLYGTGRNNEPDDAVKKLKEDIRRVKGLLLSARSFPAAVR